MLLQLPEEQRPRDLTDAALLRGLRARKFRVDFTCVRCAAHRPHGPPRHAPHCGARAEAPRPRRRGTQL
jgi:hypothetical protein